MNLKDLIADYTKYIKKRINEETEKIFFNIPERKVDDCNISYLQNWYQKNLDKIETIFQSEKKIDYNEITRLLSIKDYHQVLKMCLWKNSSFKVELFQLIWRCKSNNCLHQYNEMAKDVQNVINMHKIYDENMIQSLKHIRTLADNATLDQLNIQEQMRLLKIAQELFHENEDKKALHKVYIPLACVNQNEAIAIPILAEELQKDAVEFIQIAEFVTEFILNETLPYLKSNDFKTVINRLNPIFKVVKHLEKERFVHRIVLNLMLCNHGLSKYNRCKEIGKMWMEKHNKKQITIDEKIWVDICIMYAVEVSNFLNKEQPPKNEEIFLSVRYLNKITELDPNNETCQSLLNQFLIYIPCMQQGQQNTSIDKGFNQTLENLEPQITEIDIREIKMADKLKQCCIPQLNQDGEVLGYCEDVKKLDDSAKILKKLGEFYLYEYVCQLVKDDQSLNIQLKLNFIRCSALLNGAKVRYQILHKQEKCKNIDFNITNIEELLQQLAVLAQTAASSTCEDVDLTINELTEFSKAIFQNHIIPMRQYTTNFMKTITEVKNSYSDVTEQRLDEKHKVIQIKKLMDDITEKYLKMVQEIAKKCEKILGTPPCEYCIVGLGSLARQEITPYSDFEHIIVLDEKATTDKIEYFRWYTVIFQLIIINFGETFIKSVGVKSLNDLTSTDQTKNWFYDSITPVGIAFDGMVPHSSSTPLGSQETTTRRKHIVELIKPVKSMAQYLTTHEHIKNGYWLREILARPCHVFGTEKIFYHFFAEVKEILSRIEKDTSLPEDIPNDILKIMHDRGVFSSVRLDVSDSQNRDIICQVYNKNIRNITTVMLKNTLNVKRDFYRPAVTCIAVFAKICDIRDSQSFSIIQCLYTNGIIGPETVHDFSYMIATVCQLRLNSYINAENARENEISLPKILQWLGKASAVDMFVILAFLQQILHESLFTKQPPQRSNKLYNSRNNVLTKLSALSAFNLNEELIITGEKWIKEYQTCSDKDMFYDIWCACKLTANAIYKLMVEKKSSIQKKLLANSKQGFLLIIDGIYYLKVLLEQMEDNIQSHNTIKMKQTIQSYITGSITDGQKFISYLHENLAMNKEETVSQVLQWIDTIDDSKKDQLGNILNLFIK